MGIPEGYIANATQESIVIYYMEQYGAINRPEAAFDLGVFELAARINGLEAKGWTFHKKPGTGTSRLGRTFSCKIYSIKSRPGELAL